jgi:hypothetical protein
MATEPKPPPSSLSSTEEDRLVAIMAEPLVVLPRGEAPLHDAYKADDPADIARLAAIDRELECKYGSDGGGDGGGGGGGAI